MEIFIDQVGKEFIFNILTSAIIMPKLDKFFSSISVQKREERKRVWNVSNKFICEKPNGSFDLLHQKSWYKISG